MTPFSSRGPFPKALLAIGLAIGLSAAALARAPDDAASDTTLFTASNDVCYRIPAIAAWPDGSIVVIAERRFGYKQDVEAAADRAPRRQRSARCSDAGTKEIVTRVSHDRGKTWDPERTVVDHKSALAPDYNVAFAGIPTIVNLGDELLLVYAVNRTKGARNDAACVRFKAEDEDHCGGHAAEQTLWTTRSKDKGATWSPPQPMKLEETRRVRLRTPSPGHGIVLASGRIVLPSYPNLLLSDDRGATWRAGATTRGDRALSGNETVVGSRGGNNVWASLRPTGASFRERGDGKPYRIEATSTDGGETYENIDYDDRFPMPPITPGFLILDHTWVFTSPVSDAPSNGRGRVRDRQNLTLTVSVDDGKSWRSCLLKAGGAGYSDLARIDHDALALVFEGATPDAADYRSAIHFRRLDLAKVRDAKCG